MGPELHHRAHKSVPQLMLLVATTMQNPICGENAVNSNVEASGVYDYHWP
jgi:hypothetical protein